MKAKVAILGAGNLGVALARGAVRTGLYPAADIILTRRHLNKIRHLADEGFQLTDNNIQAVAQAEMIFLCVQPKQLPSLLHSLAGNLDRHRHILVSTVTGTDTTEILRLSGDTDLPIIRAMPNTAVAIGESMTCLCGKNMNDDQLQKVKQFFDSLGQTLVIEERLMKAATVLAASGVAFFMRYLRAAMQGGIQLGFDADEARYIAVQTAKGAAALLQLNNSHPETEIDKVTTPEGCTIAGLNEMEHQGLSAALIKGILTSFDKINSIRS